MSFQIVINYDISGNFTFDPALVEFDPPLARLKEITRVGETFNQPFTSSTGFTFDSALTEFSAGQMQQIDQYSGATAVATYDNTIDLTDGGGILTGTAVGGATITANKLDLTGAVEKHVSYDGTSNVDGAIQTGAVKFKFTPDYNGSPATTFFLMCMSKAEADNDNLILIQHNQAGGGGGDNIQITIRNSGGMTIVGPLNLGAFVAVSGTEVEIELNWDITAGATRLFIDGNQLGATDTSTGTRDALINLLRIGDNEIAGNSADGSFADLLVFTTVQHTANYTSGYTLPETRFVEDLITLPLFTDPFTGAVQGFTAFTTTQTGAVRFNLNGLFFDGFSWVASDDSFAEMNDTATINTNISTHPVAETMNVKARTTNSASKEDVDDLLITYDVLGFSTADPVVTQNSTVLADALEGFVETNVSKPSGSDLQYIIVIDGQDKFFDGAIWVNSDGTFAQSNTATVINTNALALDISIGANLKVKSFLHSDTGIVNPSLTTITVSFSFFVPQDLPNECLVFGEILDMEGAPDVGATVRAFVNTGFFHGNNLIFVDSTTTTDSQGRWEMSLVETATVNKFMKFEITNSAGEPAESELFSDVQIPDQATAEFASIAS